MSFLSAADWTQWRGPTRDGKISKKATPWPKSLSNENLKLIWSVDLAEGYSSPIIAGSKVFTVELKTKSPRSLELLTEKLGNKSGTMIGQARCEFHFKLRRMAHGFALLLPLTVKLSSSEG